MNGQASYCRESYSTSMLLQANMREAIHGSFLTIPAIVSQHLPGVVSAIYLPTTVQQ